VHGGLSPSLIKLEEIDSIPRPLPVLAGLSADLLWSDHFPLPLNFDPSYRGLGWFFNLDAAIDFLNNNDLELIVRSHESCHDGMTWPFGAKHQQVLTIFSTSDYCNSGNSGVVVRFSESADFEKVAFNVLSDDARRRRRVLIPAWLLAGDPSKTPVSVTESDSQPEEPTWDGDGTVLTV
jgi:hypothetical protein